MMGPDFNRFACLALMLFLVGCGWVEIDGGRPGLANQRPSGGVEASDTAFRGASAVKVGRGDTVYALSRRHGVSPRLIIEANNLQAPYHLEIGQRIVLPRVKRHQVKRGETLYGISRSYGVNTFELARANDLKQPYTLYVGQDLRIPARTAVANDPQVPTPVVATRAVSKIPVPKPPSASGGFIWPVKGRVLSRYGAKAKGLHNDGINIAAPKGSPILAAENGVVVYAGNEIKGFGNLILVKHANGYVTAYAHADQMLVQRGQKIKKGSKIATVGNTGLVKTPQLHFELRKGNRAINPEEKLGKA